MFDFETTGVDTSSCMPVSVAAVRFEQGVERDAFYTLLRPGIPIPEGAAKIHGITDEQVANALELAAYAPDLERVARGAVPGGYNGETFDKPILHRFVSGTDCPLFDPAQAWIDPLIMVRSIDKYAAGSGRHRLANACTRWGVPMLDGEAHNALGDVRALGRLLARLVELGKVRTDVKLGRLLEYTAIKRAEQDREFKAYRARLASQQRSLDFDAEQKTEDPCLPQSSK
jgi:DNA polymerase III epsilon subunit-like protein